MEEWTLAAGPEPQLRCEQVRAIRAEPFDSLLGDQPMGLIVHRVSKEAEIRSQELAKQLAASSAQFPDPDAQPACWERAGAAYLRALLGDQTEALARSMSNGSVLWLRGLAGDLDPGPTPYSGSCSTRPLAMTLMKLFGTIRLLGARASAFEDENDGRLLRHVVAVPAACDTASSQGWKTELPWHMDGAYRPFPGESGIGDYAPPPRWLVFAILRQHPEIPITIASLAEAGRRLSPAAFDALERPEFMVETPDSVPSRRSFGPLPIFIRDVRGDLISRFNQAHCRALTERGAAALVELEQALTDGGLHVTVHGEPGDIVVMDNWRCLHRRSAYRPAWDGRDRWFIRVYAVAREAHG